MVEGGEHFRDSRLTEYSGDLTQGLKQLHRKVRKVGLTYKVFLSPENVQTIFAEKSLNSEIVGQGPLISDDDYQWNRAYVVTSQDRKDQGLIILSGYISDEKETRPNQVLLFGDPKPEWVEETVGHYLTRYQEELEVIEAIAKEHEKRKKSSSN